MMTKTLALVTAFSFAVSGAALAASYTLDSNGKCHDQHGKFVKAELCSHHTYQLDSKGKCRDEHGRFADSKFCHA
jgi:hypothetical protein